MPQIKYKYDENKVDIYIDQENNENNDVII